MKGKHRHQGDDEAAADSSKHAQQRLDIDRLRQCHWSSYAHTYTHRDCILYALGLGFRDLKHLYERHPDFAAVPTYAIIAAHPALGSIPLEQHIPGFSRAKALHGEQYLRLISQVPSHGRLITEPKLIDVQDKGKGKGVVVVVRTVTRDADLGHIVAENEFVAFGLGTGGFGTPWPPAPRPGAATALNRPPARAADHQVTVSTHADQAALYRLSGDWNPLHIDPAVAKQVGFPAPILHGLCTLGVSVKAVVDTVLHGDFARLRTVKVRFAKHVFPGDTLCVRMWRCEPGERTSSISSANDRTMEQLYKVVFETRVVGRGDGDGALAIASAAIEYADTPLPSTPHAHSKM